MSYDQTLSVTLFLLVNGENIIFPFSKKKWCLNFIIVLYGRFKDCVNWWHYLFITGQYLFFLLLIWFTCIFVLQKVQPLRSSTALIIQELKRYLCKFSHTLGKRYLLHTSLALNHVPHPPNVTPLILMRLLMGK